MRDKLIVASNNGGKIREIKAILGGIYREILSMKEAEEEENEGEKA